MAHETLTSVLRDRALYAELRRRRETLGLLPEPKRQFRSMIESPDLARSLQSNPSLEKIVLKKGRPALIIQHDTFELPELDTWRARLQGASAALIRAIKTVGRVEVKNGIDMDWVGTAWLLTPNVIVTNRHVAMLFARREGSKFVYRQNPFRNRLMAATLDFKEEYGVSEDLEFPVSEILYIAEDHESEADLAFLRLSTPAPVVPVPLDLEDKAPGSLVAVIGYPALDINEDPKALADIFGDVYDVKRLAPGTIMTWPGAGFHFEHDCSTLGGNSGSIVVSLDSGGAVGLHFAGTSGKQNYAIKARILKQYLESFVPGVEKPQLVSPLDHRPADPESRSRSVGDYADRQGYSPDFLNNGLVKVPMPSVPAALHDQITAVAGTTDNVLRYTHFSVVMHKERCLPWFTAVNIDGTCLERLPRSRDKWYFDPRIPESAQCGNPLYEDNDFDRGHMVRRLDPTWGDEAERANDDTFHFSNACPQHKDLNQKTWNDLEDYILDNADAHQLKVCVFTGPLFDDSDPEYRGVRIPQQFWKVVSIWNARRGALSVTGYKLSQAELISNREFVYGRYRTYQVPLRELEALTQLSFNGLEQYDPLAKDEAARPGQPLRDPRDLRLF